MTVTYDGGLGTTVQVRGADTSVPAGFDNTLVLVGEADEDETTVDENEAIHLSDRDAVEDAFGEESELVTAYRAATMNGATTIYGVAVGYDDEDDPEYYDALKAAIKHEPRFICALEEGSEVSSDLLEVLMDEAENFRFARGVVAGEDVDPDEISDYEPAEEDKRIIEVAPKYAELDGEEYHLAAAVAGRLAAQPLGSSVSYDSVNGVDDLSQEYLPTEADNFEGVTAVIDTGEILEGVTTSDESAFQDIFQVEIADETTLGLYDIAKEYAGGPNTEDERDNLESDMRIYLNSLTEQNPPLLSDAGGDDAFTVSTSLGSDDDQVEVDVAISPLDVMKQINVGIDVGTVVRYNGSSA